MVVTPVARILRGEGGASRRAALRGGLILGATLALTSISAANGPRPAPQLFTELCASCHGPDLEGGRAPSLRGQGERLSANPGVAAAIIRQGSLIAGMPAFAEALSEAEIRSLVVFVQEQARRTVDAIPQSSQRLPRDIQCSERHNYRIEVLVTELDVPWAMTFLPDGRLLFTARTGRLLVVDGNGGEPRPITGTPKVWVRDEGGLFDVIVHPDHRTNGWVYLSFSDPGPDDTGMTRIVRGRLRDHHWIDEETIFQAPGSSYTASGMNFGGRMLFDGSCLVFSIGEHGATGEAQSLALPNGKVHRVNDDGSVPSDNPFASGVATVGSIWTYGHRNPQGLARDPRTGDLWETEHGPRGGDELNHLVRGRNYGWPLITYGMNYDGTPVSAHTARPGLEQPVIHWTPSIATGPIHFYTGRQFPGWENNLFLGSLAQQELWRFETDGDRIVHRELLFKNLGPIRDIKTGPRGELYVSLELPGAPGYIVRLVPG